MGKITATVLGIDEGFQKFEQVDMIRIKSEKYTLLIMDDYMPVIGRIDGMVEIVSGEDTRSFQPIHGFYTHRKNTFELLIKEDADVR
ncbi:hypothetical protein [Hominiventricola filiformis]|uniref:Uncharacterized protein n=1 Tax=Hominiventricola filiformis TaxID=2885352 RepID=A0AAE3A3Z2_9FIRM|nr:hypothetical protein [Hominiventricola filiformis]MCC2124989.1 hypothetical protein [Hominiventricola filiformis]RHU82064.1 hypothetical protein DXC26_09995 [Clostridiaceae bacterium OM08-6BH]